MPEYQATNPLHLRHWGSGLFSREGHRRRLHRTPARLPRPEGRAAEVRSVHQHRPGDDVAVPARRGVRHRGRRGDRPRSRPLRALHGREHVARVERHRRRGLQLGHPQGAPRRLPRRHRAGRPAHHGRDQAPDPADRRDAGRRRRDHRDRRHGGRHRVAAVPGGDPPVPRGRRAPPRDVHPPHARAVHRPRGRAQDQADAALGQRAAPHRYRAGHADLPLRGRAAAGRAQEDRAVRLAAARGDRLRPRRRQHLQDPALLPRRGRGRLHPRALRDGGARSRSSAAGSGSCARPPRPQSRPPVQDRAGRQVRPARGRVPVGRRGAAPLGLPARPRRSRSTGWTPRRWTTARSARGCTAPTAS